MAHKSRQVILKRGSHQLLSQGEKPLVLMEGGGGARVAGGSGWGWGYPPNLTKNPGLQGMQLSDRQPYGQSRIGKLEGIINRPW